MNRMAYDNGYLTRDLEYLHDPGVVWTPEVEGQATAVDDPDELAYRAAGVHVPSPREPHRFGDLHGHTTQDDRLIQ